MSILSQKQLLKYSPKFAYKFKEIFWLFVCISLGKEQTAEKVTESHCELAFFSIFH